VSRGRIRRVPVIRRFVSRRPVSRVPVLGIPAGVLMAAVIGAAFVVLPLAAMVLRVDWPRFVPLVTSDSSIDALLLSLRTSVAATALCVVFGVPMAVVLARARFRGQQLLRALVLLPLVLPPVVGGIALLYTFGRRGLLGGALEVLGVEIAFSTTAVVLAQTFVALPFLVLSLEGALRTVGTRYEVVAATLGARPTTALRRVTLPLVLPAVISGAVLSFARALGEFGATLTFAGSLQGTTRTLPLEIYLQRETDPDTAVALSLVLVVVAVVIVAVAHRVGGFAPTRGAAVTDPRPPDVSRPGEDAGSDDASLGDRRRADPSRGDDARRAGRVPSGSTLGATPARRLDISLRVEARDVDLHLVVERGETVAVLGPNGAGKSTLLGAVAGLVRPDAGRAALDDVVLYETGRDRGEAGRDASEAGRDMSEAGRDRGEAPSWRAPHLRGVSLLAQEPLLFPHLTVLENVAFGPRSAGRPVDEARRSARRWLDEAGVGALAQRRPGELSGGQAQRVAVARALASEPGVLLLDEPLAALDVAVAPALRRTLRRVLADRTVVIVTHDVLDAYTLADRVVLVEGGRIVDVGTPTEVFDRPRTRFAARLAGLNLVTGVVEHDGVRVDAGTRLGVGAALGDAGADLLATEGGAVSFAVPPALVSVSFDRPDDPARECVRGELLDLEPRGDVVRLRGELLSADLTPRQAAALDDRVGHPVWFSFDRAAAEVYPAERR
jgi:molybdate transport system permease protein